MTAALLAQVELIRRLEREEESLDRRTQNIGRSWRSVGNEAQKIYDRVADTTRLLMRWTGISGLFGGLIGAGSLLGIDRLANAGSNLRTSAMGVGVSPTSLLAARVNYGRFFDPNSALSNIANLQGSLGGQVAFNTLGIPGAHTASGTDAMSQAIQAVHDLYKKTPANQRQMMPWWQHATGIFGVEGTRTIGGMSDAELARRQAGFGRDVRLGMGVTSGSLEAGQNFVIQLDRIGHKLEFQLLAALDHVIPQLEALSAHVGDVVSSFITGDGLKHLLDQAAAGLKALDDWITGDSFQSDVKTFIDDIGKLANAVDSALKFLTSSDPTGRYTAAGAAAGAAVGGVPGMVVGGAAGAAYGNHMNPNRPLSAGEEAARQFYLHAGRPLTAQEKATLDALNGRASIPKFARGGIVNIDAHAGEMVLPAPISEGLQSFFGSSGNSDFKKMVSKMDDLLTVLKSQFGGGVGGLAPYEVAAGRVGNNALLGSPIPGIGISPGGGIVSAGASPESGVAYKNRMAFEATNTIRDPHVAAAASVIAQRESGFKDVWNYLHASRPNYYTAGGYYQMLDSNWRHYGPGVGVDTAKYPHAIGAPRAMQDAVFEAMYRKNGYAPWDSRHGGSISGDRMFQNEMARRGNGVAIPTTKVDVRINNQTGGSAVTSQSQLGNPN